jgi:hypothetical protein
VGSNPIWGMNVSVRLFCVCVVLCAGSGLATGWSPVQGPTKGCRAIDRETQRERDRQIDRQTGRQTNRQIDRYAHLKCKTVLE